MHKKMDWRVFAFIIVSMTAFLTVPANIIVHIPFAFADTNSTSDSGSDKYSEESKNSSGDSSGTFATTKNKNELTSNTSALTNTPPTGDVLNKASSDSSTNSDSSDKSSPHSNYSDRFSSGSNSTSDKYTSDKYTSKSKKSTGGSSGTFATTKNNNDLTSNASATPSTANALNEASSRGS